MILALDPGSVKTGVAVVHKDGSLAWKKVIQTEDFEKEMQGVLDAYDIGVIVMGNGTHHKEMQQRTVMLLKEREKNVKIELVDEKYTTEMGETWYKRDVYKRQWYKREHPATGWRRLIPDGFRRIPVPVDDYVAWIIACIYLGIVRAEDVGHKKV